MRTNSSSIIMHVALQAFHKDRTPKSPTPNEGLGIKRSRQFSGEMQKFSEPSTHRGTFESWSKVRVHCQRLTQPISPSRTHPIIHYTMKYFFSRLFLCFLTNDSELAFDTASRIRVNHTQMSPRGYFVLTAGCPCALQWLNP